MHFLKSILNGIDHTVNFGKGLLAFIVIAPFVALIWKPLFFGLLYVVIGYYWIKFCNKLHEKYFPDSDKKMIEKVEKVFHKLSNTIDEADMKALKINNHVKTEPSHLEINERCND